MIDGLYDDPNMDERLLPAKETQDELLQTNDIHTLGDVVDAHSDRRNDLDVTTRGIDPADLREDDPLKTTVGYAGNFSNDGMAGARVDDALSPDFEEPESMMAGEYGPNDSDLTSDMVDNLGTADQQSLTLNEQEVLSSGVGLVSPGPSMPTGFQEENITSPGDEPTLANQRDEPDFARIDTLTDDVTAASRLGYGGAEDGDDLETDDVTLGT